jgi:hypothetical protein
MVIIVKYRTGLAALPFVLCFSVPALAQEQGVSAFTGQPVPSTPPAASASPSAASPVAPATPAAASGAEAVRPRLHHSPLTSVPAREPLFVTASIEHPELVKRALLIYATEGSPQAREVEFRRGATEYVAEVPAAELLPRWLEYSLELELLDGTRQVVFASRKNPHRVSVPEELMDARERALYQRLGGKRSVFSASGDYVDFGTSKAQTADALGNPIGHDVRDHYFRLEGGYTYRPLRFVTEFSLRAGVVRGQSPVPIDDGSDTSGAKPRDPFKVGLNYGAPSVRLRLADVCHVEGEFLTSVTEKGFSLGVGAAVLVGDPYGGKLTLGFESIKTFGTRFWSRMDIPATRRLTFSPIIEIADTPHANKFGVRLLGELGVDVGGGFSIGARGGYQARLFTEGGASGGGTVAYAF